MDPDEQEALSIAYITARIVRLSSGNYALFAPWANGKGMPLIHIGDLASLSSLIPSTDELSLWHEEITLDHSRQTSTSGNSLLAALGLGKPSQPLRRRI